MIRTPAVRRAFLRVPRERFVPDIAAKEGLARVYADAALLTRMPQSGLPTSSSSQPAIMAEMLERLDLRPGLRVLEIGAGTGYNAALLSTLVGPGGHVTSVELQWDLADRAAKALRDGGYPVEVVVGDAQKGRFGDTPFDRIILTASTDHVAPVWFDQLVPGGLIEMPLRFGPPGPYHQMVLTFRRVDDSLRSVAMVWGGFMFLRSAGDGGGSEQPGPSLTLNEFIDGSHRSFVQLTGEGLARMRPEARRRLASLLFGEPRARSVPVRRPATASILPFLAWAESRQGVVVGLQRETGYGVGIASTDGRSLALLVDHKPDRCRLLSYGEDGAGDLLRAEVARWRALGQPTLSDWLIEVTFGDTAPTRDGGEVRVLRRRDCWITVSWPPACVA